MSEHTSRLHAELTATLNSVPESPRVLNLERDSSIKLYVTRLLTVRRDRDLGNLSWPDNYHDIARQQLQQLLNRYIILNNYLEETEFADFTFSLLGEVGALQSTDLGVRSYKAIINDKTKEVRSALRLCPKAINPLQISYEMRIGKLVFSLFQDLTKLRKCDFNDDTWETALNVDGLTELMGRVFRLLSVNAESVLVVGKLLKDTEPKS